MSVVLEKMKKLMQQCFDGDVTMPKVMLWLIASVCVLAGIVYGLCIAPMTHGVTVASNNGNQSHCIWGAKDESEKEEDEIVE